MKPAPLTPIQKAGTGLWFHHIQFFVPRNKIAALAQDTVWQAKTGPKGPVLIIFMVNAALFRHPNAGHCPRHGRGGT